LGWGACSGVAQIIMQRLDGHWVAKRVGILEHYKSMTLAEIVLFDAYLLLANKQTWECWRTIRQLEELLPMKRRTILYAKKSLIKRGWIQKIGRSGVHIPKLYRYAGKVQNMHLSSKPDDMKVQNMHLYSGGKKDRKCKMGTSKVHDMHPGCKMGTSKVQNGHPIIEDGSIIEDDNILLGGSENSEISGLCKLPEEDRLYLNLLKSIPNYPFNFERDLSFIRDLLVDFPTLDLEQEIKDWKTWLLDRKLKGNINYRSRLRRWLKNSIRYKEEQDGKYGNNRSQSQAYGKKKGRKGFDLPSDYPIDAGGPDEET